MEIENELFGQDFDNDDDTMEEETEFGKYVFDLLEGDLSDDDDDF